jgi:uncharacterized protein YukE
MNLEGMDVDQVDSLARRMDTHTRTLESSAAVLGGLAAELSHLWRGPAAATFQHDCETLHRPAITAAASAISDMHQHLVANLTQQVRASAADASGAGAAPGAVAGTIAGMVAAGVAKAWDTTGKVQEWTRIPEYLLDKEKEIFKHTDGDPTGNGPWAWLEKHTEDPVFPHLEDTKVVRWLADTRLLKTTDEVLVKTHGYRVLGKVVAPVGLALGLAAVGVDLAQASTTAASGNSYAAANHLVDAEADAVGVFPVVGWVGEFDIEMAKMDVNQIVNGGPIPSPFSWQNLREDYAPLPGEMWQELLQDKGKLLGVAAGDHG